MSYLSTFEVADLLQVTETTIKRWADEGEIPCHKTLGGHRKFALNDIVRFAEQNSYPLTGGVPPKMKLAEHESLEFSIHTQNYGRIADIVVQEALHKNREELLQLLIYLTKHHVSIATIGDEIIRPAMVKIGDLWESGKLEVNQEHLASQSLLEAIIRLNPELRRKPSNGMSAVCACAEGDYHEIGLRLLSYVLESEGWSIDYLGANTPFETLASFIKAKKPDVICLSYTLDNSRNHFYGKLQFIGKLARSYKATFLVGGFFSGRHSPEEFQCDHISTSAHDAVSFLKDKFHLKPGPKKNGVSIL